jgi:hypothetical protein
VSTERLLEALAAFCDADTKETRQRVLEELARSELIFPAAERGRRDQGVRLAFTKDQDGRQVLPGFTDDRHLRIWLPGGGPYAKARAGGFLPTVLAGPFAGLVLNPASEASAFVDRRALDFLAAGQAVTCERALVKRWKPAPG